MRNRFRGTRHARAPGGRWLAVAALLAAAVPGCDSLPTGADPNGGVVLPHAIRGSSYEVTLSSVLGRPDRIWSVKRGEVLPAGVTLGPDGTLAGAPTASGSHTFVVRASTAYELPDYFELTLPVGEVLAPTERCADHAPTDIVTFVEPRLAAVADSLHSVTPERPLTCERILSEAVQAFYARASGVTVILSAAGLQNLTRLTTVGLSRDSIGDLAPFRDLTELTFLSVGAHALTDLSPLQGLTRLRSVTLVGRWSGRGRLVDIGPLAGLTSLTELDLGGNSVQDLEPLAGLTQLQILFLDENLIADLSPLTRLRNLRELRLQRQGSADVLTDIGPLSQLGSLTHLDVGNNPITDISALRGLTRLEVVDLSFVYGLTDVQPLIDNADFAAGATVDLTATAVSCADMDRLRAKGVLVVVDPTSPCY